jgi:hypothetical protein
MGIKESNASQQDLNRTSTIIAEHTSRPENFSPRPKELDEFLQSEKSVRIY